MNVRRAQYQREWQRGDVLAGVTVAAYLVPLAVYAVLGSSRQLSVGPESTARVKQDLLDDLKAAGFLARVGEDRIFPTLPTAVEAFRHR